MTARNLRNDGYTSSNLRWTVEFYDFPSSIPKNGASDFLPTTPSAIIASTDSEANQIISIINKVKADFKFKGKEAEVIRGLKRISIARNKATPDAKCSLTFVGAMPKSIYIGVWVIVTSVSTEKNGERKALPRFIGQVESVDVTYQMRADGLLTQVNNISIREWSAILKYAVRFDRNSLAANAFQTGSQSALNDIAGGAILGQNAPVKQLTDLVNKTYNPLGLAQTIIDLMGALNPADAFPGLTVGSTTLPTIALTAPSVPAGVLARIRAQQGGSPVNSPLNPKSPFQSGFTTTISGSHSTPSHNSGEWDGVFETQGIDKLKKNMQDAYVNNPMKPSANGIGAILQSGLAAWDNITSYCEPLVFEYYTDIWYERAGNSIIAKPVIVMRDKPFAIDAIAATRPKYSNIKKYSLYDNVPRIRIPKNNITGFRVNNNLANSPNYVIIDYTNQSTGSNQAKWEAVAKSIERLDPEMRRFGGHELQGKALFLGYTGEDTSSGIANFGGGATDSYIEWYETLRDLMVTWHSYDYQMGSGVLQVKDDNFAVSVGFNVAFEFGAYTLVGHVNSFSLEYSIDENGMGSSNMQIEMSKIVQQTESGKLNTMAPEAWGDLFGETVAPDSGFDSSGLSAGGIINAISNFLGIT